MGVAGRTSEGAISVKTPGFPSHHPSSSSIFLWMVFNSVSVNNLPVGVFGERRSQMTSFEISEPVTWVYLHKSALGQGVFDN